MKVDKKGSEKLKEIQDCVNKVREKCKILKKCGYCHNCKEKCWVYNINLILNPNMYDGCKTC